MFMKWTDLSDHMWKIHKLFLEDESLLVICDPKRVVLVLSELRDLYAWSSSTFSAGWSQ